MSGSAIQISDGGRKTTGGVGARAGTRRQKKSGLDKGLKKGVTTSLLMVKARTRDLRESGSASAGKGFANNAKAAAGAAQADETRKTTVRKRTKRNVSRKDTLQRQASYNQPQY